jgi:hypothetical protein
MILALWNYGLDVPIDKIAFAPLRSTLERCRVDGIVPKHRFMTLMRECPITLEAIRVPALTANGLAYEFQAIKRHFKQHVTNPETNEALECESESRMVQCGNEWINARVILNVLYLPTQNRFVWPKVSE